MVRQQMKKNVHQGSRKMLQWAAENEIKKTDNSVFALLIFQSTDQIFCDVMQ